MFEWHHTFFYSINVKKSNDVYFLHLTELPLCSDTENTKQGIISIDPNENKPEKPHASWTGIISFLILLLSALVVFVYIVWFFTKRIWKTKWSRKSAIDYSDLVLRFLNFDKSLSLLYVLKGNYRLNVYLSMNA